MASLGVFGLLQVHRVLEVLRAAFPAIDAASACTCACVCVCVCVPVCVCVRCVRVWVCIPRGYYRNA